MNGSEEQPHDSSSATDWKKVPIRQTVDAETRLVWNVSSQSCVFNQADGLTCCSGLLVADVSA